MTDSTYQPETAAHLRRFADRYRELAVSTWDLKTLTILNEMIRDYENEAAGVEGKAASEPTSSFASVEGLRGLSAVSS
jgi:hypothetical protein